ncbi:MULTISPECIES: hypothetical protein [Vibrio]|uniref:Uncharacterized protein n=1 Tax=Vibrio diazotrophicus TaxID=685 RepID=A0A329EDM0_VIBDI|nr:MULTISPECIES: hypothetical protein [Vibrio]RAS69287.1 hypothetical protein DET48_102116 [Vibrio diazotrophicus]
MKHFVSVHTVCARNASNTAFIAAGMAASMADRKISKQDKDI